jgi:predicted Ser/Thr protein kinase
VEGAPFGRYRLVELLGRGGMGEVWKAFDTATQRVVAVKVLPPQMAADPVFEERFRHEAFAAASLNNPHVVPIHNFGEIEGRLYVDMRLIEGQDLEHVLADGPLDQARAVKIIEQIASALRAAHKIGLVHRDVKPSNILIAEDDFSYLIDFGIARAAGETKLTATGNVVGTWPYMAPERFTTGQSDTRSDIYALTCVLYECLTSSRPFPGNSVEQQIAGHLTTPPPRPSISRPEVTPELDAVIAAGMAKDPEKRYSTTTEMARAARAAITNAASHTRPAQPASAQTAAGVAPSVPTRAGDQGKNAWAPTQAQPEEETEKDVRLPWGPTRAGRPDHVEQASAPTRAQPAEQAPPTTKTPAAQAPTQAQPAAQAPTQAQPAEHAPPTVMAPPAWAPTQAGTPEHVAQAWAETSLGAPVPHVENAAAPTQAQPAEGQHQLSPLDDAEPWPWYKRTAVVIPIAVVLIVAAVATILLVISGDEEPAPGGQAGGGTGGTGDSGASGLDGTYAFKFGGPTQPNGQPFENAPGGDETWVIKSACHTKGCVAGATKVNGSISTATTLVLDEVDEQWESVNSRQGTCQGGAGAGEVWESLSLESRPDGSLQGEFIARSTDPSCASNRSVTATRTGDADAGVNVADPAAMPARVASPAQALYGRYQETDTYREGNRNADVSFDIQSFCLRTGERCLSYWLSPTDIKVLIFANNEWVLANRSSDAKCEKGGPAHREVTLQYPLPSPAQDPITLLTGRGHYTITGACPFNSDFDSKVQRTGD